MARTARALLVTLLLTCLLGGTAAASAYNGKPKLVVLIVVDQLRADLLQRHAARFAPNGGFRAFLEQGAYFTDCLYDYANTHTAPGHATLGTGAYSTGHGILTNSWWDPSLNAVVESTDDAREQVLGGTSDKTGASPRRMLASGIGDELKMATAGRAKVFGVALKDRSAILPTGFAADGAYWIDSKDGQWITSTYYGQALPAWVAEFNAGGAKQKYIGREWKSGDRVLANTTMTPEGFYEIVGGTSYSNDYTLDFTRALIENEKLGDDNVTDFLVVSFSSYDILGHRKGPDSLEIETMTLDLDRQIGQFIAYLNKRLGRDNVWLALSADHGIPPVAAYANKLRYPAIEFDRNQLRRELNAELAQMYPDVQEKNFIPYIYWTTLFVNPVSFQQAKVSQAEAERVVGELMRKREWVMGYVTKSQLERGELPLGEMGRLFANSLSPYGGWWVKMLQKPFTVPSKGRTDHAAAFSYDRHVPMGLIGNAFTPGTYRTKCEPVDLAPTLSSLLGISRPSSAVGRVLHEAVRELPAKGTRPAAPQRGVRR